MAPEVGFKPTTYRLEGGYCCSLSYSGILWWAARDSNPEPSGYEPEALTSCANGPDWRRKRDLNPTAVQAERFSGPRQYQLCLFRHLVVLRCYPPREPAYVRTGVSPWTNRTSRRSVRIFVNIGARHGIRTHTAVIKSHVYYHYTKRTNPRHPATRRPGLHYFVLPREESNLCHRLRLSLFKSL